MHNTPNMVCYNTQNLIIGKSQILKQKNPRNLLQYTWWRRTKNFRKKPFLRFAATERQLFFIKILISLDLYPRKPHKFRSACNAVTS